MNKTGPPLFRLRKPGEVKQISPLRNLNIPPPRTAQSIFTNQFGAARQGLMSEQCSRSRAFAGRDGFSGAATAGHPNRTRLYIKENKPNSQNFERSSGIASTSNYNSRGFDSMRGSLVTRYHNNKNEKRL